MVVIAFVVIVIGIAPKPNSGTPIPLTLVPGSYMEWTKYGGRWIERNRGHAPHHGLARRRRQCCRPSERDLLDLSHGLYVIYCEPHPQLVPLWPQHRRVQRRTAQLDQVAGHRLRTAGVQGLQATLHRQRQLRQLGGARERRILPRRNACLRLRTPGGYLCLGGQRWQHPGAVGRA